MKIALLGVLAALVAADHTHLMPGLGSHHHPISTTSPEAQRFFDQGLTLVFAFNHEEAVRSFRRAAELDPRAAMPLWGIALALGPNINLDVDAERERAAYEAVQKARALSRHAPAIERDYVMALARRYSVAPGADLKALAVEYKNAMGGLVARYPDDLDAATLYAESAMDLRPWQLWTADGAPAEGTEEIVRVLESVLRRDPNHVGANHYYVHAVEASPRPERALASAARLETLVPAAGHLVHMPAHVFMRTGDYAGAARANEQAIAVDRAYLATANDAAMYRLMYYTHNLHFLSMAEAMRGRSAAAVEAAAEVASTVKASLAAMPAMDAASLAMAEMLLAAPTFVALRFHRWQEVLDAPEPERTLRTSHALWRYARGVALAVTGRRADARAEHVALAAERRELPADAFFGLNAAGNVLDVAAAVLDARLAVAAGDRKRAIEHWTRAVALQDALAYNEPPDWYYPVRESLGAELLRAGRPADAETVFRADLARNPRNPRSLFGLWQSLKSQKRAADGEWVRRQFDAAWRDADTTLREADATSPLHPRGQRP